MSAKPTAIPQAAVAVIGEAPALSTYLAELREGGASVSFFSQIDERLQALVRSHPRIVLALGDGVILRTAEQTVLSQMRRSGAKILSLDPTLTRLGDLPIPPILPWSIVHWFMVETHRQHDVTAATRIHYAHHLLSRCDDKTWLARALLVCPGNIEIVARQFSESPRTFTRRLTRHQLAWHTMCEELIVEACKFHEAARIVKWSVIAAELGLSVSTLRRRLVAQRVSNENVEAT